MKMLCDFVRNYDEEMKSKGYDVINTLWFSENEETKGVIVQIITKWLDHINDSLFEMNLKQEIELLTMLKEREKLRGKK